MSIKILRFSGPSIYCRSASIVLRFERTHDFSDLVPDTGVPFLLAVYQLARKVNSKVLLPDDNSCALDSKARLFLDAWASICVLGECDVFHYGEQLINNDRTMFISCTDNDIAGIAADHLIKILINVGEHNALSTNEITKFIDSLKQLLPGSPTRCLIRAAKELGIPYTKLFGPHMISFGAGRNSIIFNRQSPGDESHHGTLLSRDKHKSKLLFVKIGLPVTDSVLISSSDSIENITDSFFPCVVKPIDGSQGVGVYVNLKNRNDLVRAVQKSARTTNLPLMVEREIFGDDIRLLVCRGELLIAAKRSRPFVVGDGVCSITQLVKIENQERVKTSHSGSHLPQITMNEEALDYLLTQGFTSEYIPKEGEKVYVRGTPHGTHGGSMVNVTNEVHPEIISLAILASERIGGALSGLDYISADHTKPPNETGGVFLEINTFPGLKPIELLNEQDRLNCMQKIFGKALLPIEITVFVGHSPSDITGLKASVIDERTAWYCDGRVRFGRPVDEKTCSYVPVPLAYERCLLDSRADRLVFLLTSEEFRNYGLPCNRIRKAVVINPVKIGADARDALRRASDLYEEICF